MGMQARHLMIKNSTELLGTLSIPKLLIQQAIPASIGILVMSLNILIDTIFVGHWIGSNAIAAINVVLPVSFFIAALSDVKSVKVELAGHLPIIDHTPRHYRIYAIF